MYKEIVIKKGKFIISLVIISMILLLISGCNKTKEYKVKFDSNGGSIVDSITVKENETIEEPDEPTKEGYSFTGWYYNNIEFDFDTKIKRNITLKAKWKSNGKGIELKDKEVELRVDEEFKLEIKKLLKGIKKTDLIWLSSNNKIAVVDQEGKVKAYEVGEAIITVKTKDGERKATVKVIVKEKEEEESLKEDNNTEIIKNSKSTSKSKTKKSAKTSSSVKQPGTSTTPSQSTPSQPTPQKPRVNTEELIKRVINKVDTEWYQNTRLENKKIVVDILNVKSSINKNLGKYITNILNEIIEDKNVESVDLIYGNKKITYKKIEEDIEIWLKENSNYIFGKDYEKVINYDLIGKHFSVKINLNSSVVKEESNPEKYELTFTGEKVIIDTDSIFNKALTQIDNTIYLPSTLNNGKVDINIKNVKTPISSNLSSNLKKILSSIMTNEDIKSVDLIYENKKIEEDIEKWLKENSKTIFGKDYEDVINYDLVGQRFNIKINLEEYATKNTENPEKYELTFTGAKEIVDTDKIITEALTKIDTSIYNPSALETGKININILKIKALVKESLSSNLNKILNSIMTNEDIKSVDLIYENKKIEKDIETWLRENSNDIFGKSYEEVINYDLIGKKFNIKINLKNYSDKKDNNPELYELTFTGAKEIVDTDKIMKEALTKIDTNIYELTELKAGKVNLNIKNIKALIKENLSSNLKKILSSIMTNEDIESVDLIYENRKIEDIEAWLKENSNNIFGKSYEEAINYDLIGKKFNLKINLKNYSDKKDNNPELYELTFTGEKVIIDTDSIFNKALTQIDNTLYLPSTLNNGKVDINIKNIKTPISSSLSSNLKKILNSIRTNEDIESVDLIYGNKKIEEDIETWLKENSETIFGKDYEEVINYDLIGKKFNIKINLEEYATKKTENPEKYELTFTGAKEIVDTDKIITEALTKIDTSIYNPSALETGKININILKIKALIKESLSSNLNQILNSIMTNKDIESVDLIYENKKIEEDIETWLKENSNDIFGKDYEEVINYDLVGKKFSLKINLKNYSDKKDNNPEIYELTFTGEKEIVDTDMLIDKAINLLDSGLYQGTRNNGEVTIDIKNKKASILSGAALNIMNILNSLIETEGVIGVNFSYELEIGKIITFEYTKNTNYSEMKKWLEENGISIFGTPYNQATNADIIGKSFKLTIELDEYTKKMPENAEEYKLSFTGAKEIIDTDSIFNKALTQIDNTIYLPSTLNNGKVDINIKNIKTPISSSLSSNLKKILSSIMTNEDIESVDLIYENKKIEDTEAWLKENSNNIFGKSYEEAINYDLIGKKFNIKINLSEYTVKKAENPEEYEIIFNGDKISVNTDTLLKDSVEKIDKKIYTNTQVNNSILTIIVKDIDMDIINGIGLGLLKNLSELATSEYIQSIDFKSIDNSKSVLSITKDTTPENIGAWLKENSKELFNKVYTNSDVTFVDAINKEFAISINLYPLYKNEASSFEYRIVFKPTEYNVTFDYNDSMTPSTVKKVSDGSMVEIPTEPTREGYKFIGWYEENAILEFDFNRRIKEDIKLVAHWVLIFNKKNYILDKLMSEKNKFTTIYDDNTDILNVTIIKPKESIDSIGLYDDIKRLLQKKEVESITITHNSKDYIFKDSNTVQNNLDDFYNDISSSAGKTLKSLKNQNFDIKIIVNSDGDGFNTNTKTEIVYKINFRVLQHKVTFNYNDGRENKVVLVDNYDKISYETPTREGYKFIGWYQNSTIFDFSEEITNDITLIAHWSKQHKVTFDYGYDNKSEMKLVDDNSTITGKSLTRDGYKFMGWYKDGEETPFDFKTPITEDLKLTAHWSSTLSDAELKSVEKASAEALETINNNGIINVKVDQTNNIITINHYDSEPGYNGGLDDGIMYILTGSKAHKALYNFLNNQYVDSIELYLDGMDSVKVTADMIKDYDSMAESASKFLKPFEDATGLDPLEMTYKDLIDMKKEVKVKINLVDGKAFENEEDALYTFRYTNIPLDVKVTNYNVAFDYNDGTNTVITKTITDGSTVTAPAEPQREGYKFAGWYEDKSILPFDFSMKITKDTKLIAHWVLVTKEEDYILYSNVKENYIYSSYYNSINNAVKVTIIQPNSDISAMDLVKNIKQLVQRQEVKSVTMKYNNYDYVFYYNKSLDDNINKFLVDITEKEEEVSKQLKDLKGKEIQVKVSIDPNVSQLNTTSSTEISYSINFKVLQQQVVLKYNNNQSNETIIVDNYSTIYEKIPKRTGYRFLGWYLEGTNTKFDFDTKITKATVLVAHWIKQHKVTFNYGYNNMTEMMLVDDNTTISKSNPVRAGYKFLGWYKAGGQTPFDLKTPITGDITLTAHWVKKYTVTFDLGYDNKTHVIEIDENSSLTPYSVNRAGYKFLGWYLNDNLYNFSSSIDSDIVLKAKWLEIVDLSKQSEAAIKTINGNNRMAIDVNQNTHIITIYWWKSKTEQAVFALAGSGARTALANFINDPNVENVELFLEGMDSVTVTYDMVESTQALDRNSQKFMKPFLDATGFDNIWRIFMIDLYNAMQTKNIKVKINLVEGKTFEKEEDAYYTFALVLDNPPESKTTSIKNNFNVSLKGLNFN